MIDIKRISISELSSLVFHPDYPNWEIIPISRHRAYSYIQNPRCSPGDVVLYLAYINQQLVGYRTIMPDKLHHNGQAISVGWLSGNWVDPTKRRQGIASELFEAAFSDWKGMLLYTNYAVDSKAVYDKSNDFQNVTQLKGIRIYIRPCLSKVFSRRSRFFRILSPFWHAVDFFFTIFNPLPIIAKLIPIKGISIEYLSSPDEEVKTIFGKQMLNTPSKRGDEELDWILDHPWLVSSPFADRIGSKYFFSSAPKRFEQLLVKVFRGSEFLGFILVNVIDKFVTTPYIVCPVAEAKLFAKIVLKQSFIMDCSRITTYCHPIAMELKRLMPFGLFSFELIRNFFATKNCSKIIGEDSSFVEGDGDCAFV